MDNFAIAECMDAKQVYSEFNPRLVEALPLKDPMFIAMLTKQNLFSGTLKEEVVAATVRADAAFFFLFKAIERPLNVDDTEPFDKLLTVMDDYNDSTINMLAKAIKQKMPQSNRTEG